MRYTDKHKPPKVDPPDFDEIADELKALPQWILWKYLWQDGSNGKPGSWQKIPLKTDGYGASSTDPATWSDFESVRLAFNERQGHFSGIGFVFTRESGIVGIDLDNCLTWEEGQYMPIMDDWVKHTLVAVGDTYMEYSPSMTGVHFYVRANPKQALKRPEIEIYAEGRFFTVTGKTWGVSSIADATEAVDRIIEAESKQEPAKEFSPGEIAQSLPKNLLRIEDRLQIAFHGSNGAAIKKLFDGEWQNDYPSESEADLGLANYLAFYSDGNPSLLALMMECSKLVRPKWSKSYGNNTTYLSRTIDTALKGRTEYFKANQSLISFTGKPSDEASARSNRVYRLLDIGQAALKDRSDPAAKGLIVDDESFGELDQVYRPRKKLLTVIVGDPAAGKTTFAINYLYYLGKAHNLRIGLTAFENSPVDLTHSLVSAHLRKPVFPEFEGCCTDEEYLQALDQIGGQFTIYEPTWEESNCQALSQYWEDSTARTGLDAILLDPFSNLQPTDQLLGKYTDFANQQLGFLWRYVQTRSLMGFLLCHPTKEYDRSAGPPKLRNINGTGGFDRCADFGIGLTRINGKLVAEINKVRHWRTGEMGAMVAWNYDQKKSFYLPTTVPPLKKSGSGFSGSLRRKSTAPQKVSF